MSEWYSNCSVLNPNRIDYSFFRSSWKSEASLKVAPYWGDHDGRWKNCSRMSWLFQRWVSNLQTVDSRRYWRIKFQPSFTPKLRSIQRWADSKMSQKVLINGSPAHQSLEGYRSFVGGRLLLHSERVPWFRQMVLDLEIFGWLHSVPYQVKSHFRSLTWHSQVPVMSI